MDSGTHYRNALRRKHSVLEKVWIGCEPPNRVGLKIRCGGLSAEEVPDRPGSDVLL